MQAEAKRSSKKEGSKSKVTTIRNVGEYEELRNNGLVVVDFNTEWCNPCKKFAPVFEEMAEKYEGATFLSVNAEKIEHEDCQAIKSLPTFKIFLNGKLRREFSGPDKQRLEEYIQRFQIQIHLNGKVQRSFTPEFQAVVKEYMKTYAAK